MSPYSWEFLEKGIEKVMTNLRDGMDMKTVWDSYIVSLDRR